MERLDILVEKLNQIKADIDIAKKKNNINNTRSMASLISHLYSLSKKYTQKIRTFGQRYNIVCVEIETPNSIKLIYNTDIREQDAIEYTTKHLESAQIHILGIKAFTIKPGTLIKAQ